MITNPCLADTPNITLAQKIPIQALRLDVSIPFVVWQTVNIEMHLGSCHLKPHPLPRILPAYNFPSSFMSRKIRSVFSLLSADPKGTDRET